MGSNRCCRKRHASACDQLTDTVSGYPDGSGPISARDVARSACRLVPQTCPCGVACLGEPCSQIGCRHARGDPWLEPRRFHLALVLRHASRSDDMKLMATMMVTLDGVYQGPGGPDEDRRGGFDRGGWTAAYGDDEGWRFLVSWFE